ncbi:cytochrome c [Phenylobacterium sp. LjRoot225]|uniref:c-type cytochrome n=1 Tax=Phenylobacterium sp. LjRoot225 TaxID=3342285 RepID=UPI003ECCFC12
MTDKTGGQEARPRRRWLRIASFALLLTIVGCGAAAYAFRPLPLPAPAPLERHDAGVEKGEYLARIGNCAACHTVPGQARFAGGVKFETPFGVLFSTNITPDPEHGIGRWSYEQFHASMKHAIRPDGAHLYPAFPYTSFAKLSDEDIASLYLYFRTTEPVAQPNRENRLSFPFNNRSLLHFWKGLFHDSAAFTPDATKSPAWNRGAYLVEGVAHCGACHTPRNVLGGLDEDRALQGGAYVDQVASGAYRTWSAVDLTPGRHGLNRWSATDIALYLTEGKNGHAVVHGPMNEVFESTRHLTKQDAVAIATYLKGIDPSPKRSDLSFLRSRVDDGEIVYTVHCGTCHLPDGKGDKVLGVPLGGNAIVQANDPSSLINVILYGPDLPPPPFASSRTTMKPFGKRLSDEDVAAVASYLRSSFGNNADAVTPEQVRRQR